MARLHKHPYPGAWDFFGGDFTRLDKLLAEIPQDRIVSFPVADGFALYFVYSEKPLVLQHIPYGDAWQVDAALIRGLRLSDINKRLVVDRSWHAMVAKPISLKS